MLDAYELEELFSEIYNNLIEEIHLANRLGHLDEVLKKYGIKSKKTEKKYFELNRAKILLVGDLQVSIDIIYKILKDYGLTTERIEHVSYDQAKTFPWNKIENSMIYTDIFLGPIPHKLTSIQKYSSLIAMIEANSESYPKLHRLEANQMLKITKTSFMEALKKSELINSVIFDLN
jgi:hypothetical protein